jgi:NADPH-dependent ferric siderophore reductase
MAIEPRQANRPPPRVYTVLGKRHVTPNMLRVTLGGPGTADFPAGQDGGYLKLRVPSLDDPGRLIVRTYTIAAQRAGTDGDELDVDFALHGGEADVGPATRWALAAEPGARLEAGGPGAAKPLAEGADQYLVAGDMTALPAIAANLARLPDDACGTVFLRVTAEADRQDLACPPGVTIHWLVHPEPGADPDLLANAVRALPWPKGSPYAWVATEFSAMKALRSYLRDERGLGTDRLYISSYWKAGLTEDGHREAKRADAGASLPA